MPFSHLTTAPSAREIVGKLKDLGRKGESYTRINNRIIERVRVEAT